MFCDGRPEEDRMKAIKTLGLALVCVAAGCGSSSSGRGGTGATSVAGVSSAQPTAGSLVGTWVGRDSNRSANGLLRSPV